jgi:hypothetical protein
MVERIFLISIQCRLCKATTEYGSCATSKSKFKKKHLEKHINIVKYIKKQKPNLDMGNP